jgi:hypothetical protein
MTVIYGLIKVPVLSHTPRSLKLKRNYTGADASNKKIFYLLSGDIFV